MDAFLLLYIDFGDSSNQPSETGKQATCPSVLSKTADGIAK